MRQGTAKVDGRKQSCRAERARTRPMQCAGKPTASSARATPTAEACALVVDLCFRVLLCVCLLVVCLVMLLLEQLLLGILVWVDVWALNDEVNPLLLLRPALVRCARRHYFGPSRGLRAALAARLVGRHGQRPHVRAGAADGRGRCCVGAVPGRLDARGRRDLDTGGAP